MAGNNQFGTPHILQSHFDIFRHLKGAELLTPHHSIPKQNSTTSLLMPCWVVWAIHQPQNSTHLDHTLEHSIH